MKRTSRPSRTTRGSASWTIRASRWQVPLVTIWTTGTSRAPIRWASRSVCTSPSMTAIRALPFRARSVCSRRLVLPDPGALSRPTPSTRWRSSSRRFSRAMSPFFLRIFCSIVIRFAIVHHKAREIQLVSVLERHGRCAAGPAHPKRFVEDRAQAAAPAHRAERLEADLEPGLRPEDLLAERLEIELHRVRAHAGEQPHRDVDLCDPAPRGPALRSEVDQLPNDRRLVHDAIIRLNPLFRTGSNDPGPRRASPGSRNAGACRPPWRRLCAGGHGGSAPPAQHAPCIRVEEAAASLRREEGSWPRRFDD